MANLTEERKNEIKELVYDFFAEECEVDKDELTEDTDIMNDLDGDSLLFVELVELMKKKYDLDIQLQSVGKYLLKHPAETIAEVLTTANLIYEHENNIIGLIK